MKLVIPNAKELNTRIDGFSPLPLSPHALSVARVLEEMTEEELASFYAIKPEKAQLEADRWKRILTQQAKSFPALYLYDGLMYRSMRRASMRKEVEDYLHRHLRIATALYGLIAPFDLISPHRLDFQGNLMVQGNSLKQYWRPFFDQEIENEEVVVSLLSTEFEQVFSPHLREKLIRVVFMEERNGSLKVHSTISKKGRGALVSEMAAQNICTIQQLTQVECDGFTYQETLSTPKKLVFTRVHPQ